MSTVKHGGISIDPRDKKPYAHARRSNRTSSIGVAAKSKKDFGFDVQYHKNKTCLLYTSPSPRDATLSRMPSSA